MACKAKYWNHKGRFQKQYEKLFHALVPRLDNPPTYHGMLLRNASKIYYDIYNNGGCNLKLPFLQGYGDVLMHAQNALRPIAEELGVTKLVRKMGLFVNGLGTSKDHDEVVDVVVKFAQRERAKTQKLDKLIEDAQWILDFLNQYPPYFADGKSMETDLGEGLDQLARTIQAVKKQRRKFFV